MHAIDHFSSFAFLVFRGCQFLSNITVAETALKEQNIFRRSRSYSNLKELWQPLPVFMRFSSVVWMSASVDLGFSRVWGFAGCCSIYCDGSMPFSAQTVKWSCSNVWLGLNRTTVFWLCGKFIVTRLVIWSKQRHQSKLGISMAFKQTYN